MEYLHNGLTKAQASGNTNNYILKVNSRDRDITREPNPFNGITLIKSEENPASSS